MQCPECKCGELAIHTEVTIRQHDDESWDMETPFRYQESDVALCMECDWEGTVAETHGA